MNRRNFLKFIATSAAIPFIPSHEPQPEFMKFKKGDLVKFQFVEFSYNGKMKDKSCPLCDAGIPRKLRKGWSMGEYPPAVMLEDGRRVPESECTWQDGKFVFSGKRKA